MIVYNLGKGRELLLWFAMMWANHNVFSTCIINPAFVRYSTIFTMFPVFSLVLDKDVSSDIAMTYPELYKDMTKVQINSSSHPHMNISFSSQIIV